MHLTSLESHHPQDRCGTPSFAATVLSRSALGLDASTFNASACYRLRGGCATASEYYLIWLAGFASSRGEVMGMLCYCEYPSKQKSAVEIRLIQYARIILTRTAPGSLTVSGLLRLLE